MQCVYLCYWESEEGYPNAAWVGPEGLSLDRETWLNAIGAPGPEGVDHTRRWEWLRERGLTRYGLETAYAEWVEGHPDVVPVLIKAL